MPSITRVAAAPQATPAVAQACAEPMQLAALLASQLQGMRCHPDCTAPLTNVLLAPASPPSPTNDS